MGLIAVALGGACIFRQSAKPSQTLRSPARSIQNVYTISGSNAALLNSRPQEQFGRSVSISGNKTLVSSDVSGVLAYLFDSMTGAHLKTFNDPTGAHTYCSVALDSDYAVIAVHYEKVYVFDVVTGSLLQTIQSPTSKKTGRVHSVAISGNNLVVGELENGGEVDAAYLYDVNTGALRRTFYHPSPQFGTWSGQFGYSVAVSGKKVLVGARLGLPVESAFLFDADTGSLLKSFDSPTPSHFGESVAISENRILVGAPEDDTNAEDAGSAYVFDTETGVLLWAFNNPSGRTREGFGHAVAISGVTAVVGCEFNGGAYMYDILTGELLKRFSNPHLSATRGLASGIFQAKRAIKKDAFDVLDYFGSAVAISEDQIIVGDSTRPGKNGWGAVYVYDIPESRK